MLTELDMKEVVVCDLHLMLRELTLFSFSARTVQRVITQRLWQQCPSYGLRATYAV